jgi:hypothetical protein
MSAREGRVMLEGALRWCEQDTGEDFMRKLRKLAQNATVKDFFKQSFT